MFHSIPIILQEFADQFDLQFMETSAKHNENVEELFIETATKILQTVKDDGTEDVRGTISLTKPQTQTKKAKCC